MKKYIYTICFLLSLNFLCSAQFQKSSKDKSLTFAGFKDYYSLSISHQRDSDYLTFSIDHYKTDESVYTYQSYFFDARYGYNLFRVNNLYTSISGGIFAGYTTANRESVRGKNDFSSGFLAEFNIEYYLNDRFSILLNTKQLLFLKSDYYNTLLLYSFGLKFEL